MNASPDNGGAPPPDERPAIRHAYGARADDYLQTHGDELERSPWDREVVDDALATLATRDRVADVGCGPGHVAAHLARGGLSPIGFDLTSAMLRVARSASPSVPLVGAELPRVPVRDGGCSGALCRYVVHHIARPALGAALGELRRILVPGAPLLLVAQGGEGTRLFEHDQGGVLERVTVTLYAADELAAALRSAGFTIGWVRQRDPHAEEYPATKLAVVASAA